MWVDVLFYGIGSLCLWVVPAICSQERLMPCRTADTHTQTISYLVQLGSSIAVHKLTSPPEECQWVVLGCESDSQLDRISRERGCALRLQMTRGTSYHTTYCQCCSFGVEWFQIGLSFSGRPWPPLLKRAA